MPWEEAEAWRGKELASTFTKARTVMFVGVSGDVNSSSEVTREAERTSKAVESCEASADVNDAEASPGGAGRAAKATAEENLAAGPSPMAVALCDRTDGRPPRSPRSPKSPPSTLPSPNLQTQKSDDPSTPVVDENEEPRGFDGAAFSMVGADLD